MTAKSPIALRAQIFVALLLALGLAVVASSVGADQASAQDSSFCEQYPNDPSCDDDDNDNDNDNNDDDSGPGSGPLSGDDLNGTGGGSLPFTGYPLSPLVILLLILLASGLAIRGYTAVRDRLATRNTLA